jgi:hypothetical protein
MFLSACVTMRHCPIETLQPAKLTVEGPKRSIAIYASETLLTESIMSNSSNTTGVPRDSLIANILYSLQHFWEKAPGYEAAKFVIYIAKTEEHPEPSNFDLTVQLENLQIKNIYYGQEYSWVEWEAYLHVNYTAKWTIRNASGTPVDEYTDRNLMEWRSGLRTSKMQAVMSLPSVKDAWWDMGIVIAKNYAARIVPQWKTGTRDIYLINKYPELSMQAYTAMLNYGYARAFNIWENMLMMCRKHGQKRIKSQITYNMAVAWEYQNQLDEAIYWAQRSANLNQRKQTVNYLNILRERKQHQTKLDLQLNN